jgi:hypothetical protein
MMDTEPKDGAEVAPQTAAGMPETAPEALAGLVVEPSRMIVFGWTGRPLPVAATVRFADDTVGSGAWRLLIWEPAQPAAAAPFAFVAAVALDNAVRAQSQSLVLDDGNGNGSAPLTLPPMSRLDLDIDPLLVHLQDAAADPAEVFDFLRLTMQEDAFGGQTPWMRNFLQSLLAAVSRQDGFIEIFGLPEYGGLFVQGWSVHLKPGPHQVGVFTEDFDVQTLEVATFDRPDLLDPAKGVVGYAKDLRVADLDMVKALHFRSGHGLFHLDVVDQKQRIVLSGTDTVAHVKHMIPKMEADAPVVRAFKRLCRPRFPGHETVSAVSAPVRFACDLALMLPDAGIFVSGWLLDPAGQVALSLLKSTGNFYARLDPVWARRRRPDVNEGFAANPVFDGLLPSADCFHGFMAFVPRPKGLQAGEQFYFEIVLKDESCGFLPVTFSAMDPGLALRHVLSTVQCDDPSIDRLIADHLGPTAAALAGRRTMAKAARERITFGPHRRRPRVSAIVPVASGCRDLDVNFACLAADPDFRSAEIIVVATHEGAEHLAGPLKRQATFYGLSGSLVLSAEPLDYFEALALGAAQAAADLLLFLSPTVLPRGHGWLSRLTEALATAGTPGMISPTLLYEDDSIRFAGRACGTAIDTDPCDGRLAGYAPGWIDATGMTAVSTGAAECCLIERSLFSEIGGFSRELVSACLKNRDFALKLRERGRNCYWLPEVSLYALDADEAEPDHQGQLGARIDRWNFERRWLTPATAPLPA